MRRPSRPAATLALLLLASPACMRWSSVGAPAPERTLDSARVTLASGEVTELRNVDVRADSVLGYAGTVRVGFAAHEVRRVEVKRVSAVRTALAVVGGVVLTYVALIVYLVSTLDW